MILGFNFINRLGHKFYMRKCCGIQLQFQKHNYVQLHTLLFYTTNFQHKDRVAKANHKMMMKFTHGYIFIR